MIQKIQYYLLKFFLFKKKKLIALACLVFLGLLIVPQVSKAFALDLADTALNALDFIDNSVLRKLVAVALLGAESYAFLWISSGLFDWSVQLPAMLKGNPIVQAGWSFTSGLANLFFILIFIVIALSYILKLENFGLNDFEIKKTLPRLIIIAILINFSLLFVQMISDVGWIVQNSFTSVFFTTNTGLGTAAAKALLESSNKLIPLVFGVPVAYMAIAPIPYVNVAALLMLGMSLLLPGGGPLLSLVMQVTTVIIFNFTLGSIFLIYAVLFLAKIAVIWLLAIFAPLALIANVLPKTQKYFTDWLKNLVQWTLFGIAAYFLIGLGLVLFGQVNMGEGQVVSFSGVAGNWVFFDTFYKYFFLIIYSVVVLGALKKTIPDQTQAIWDAVDKGGKAMITTAGPLALKPMVKAIPKISQITGIKDAVNQYRLNRSLGSGKIDSLASAGRMWRSTIKKNVGKAGKAFSDFGALSSEEKYNTIVAKAGAVNKGVLGAVKKIAEKGLVESKIIKARKKKPTASKKCPGGPPGGPIGGTCGNMIDADENPCHICGHIFP